MGCIIYNILLSYEKDLNESATLSNISASLSVTGISDKKIPKYNEILNIMPKKLRLDQLLIKKKLVNSLGEAINLINNRKMRVSNYNSKFLFEHTLVNEDSDIKIAPQNFV